MGVRAAQDEGDGKETIFNEIRCTNGCVTQRTDGGWSGTHHGEFGLFILVLHVGCTSRILLRSGGVQV